MQGATVSGARPTSNLRAVAASFHQRLSLRVLGAYYFDLHPFPFHPPCERFVEIHSTRRPASPSRNCGWAHLHFRVPGSRMVTTSDYAVVVPPRFPMVSPAIVGCSFLVGEAVSDGCAALGALLKAMANVLPRLLPRFPPHRRSGINIFRYRPSPRLGLD